MKTRIKNLAKEAAATVALVAIGAIFVGPWVGAAQGDTWALAGTMITAPVAILVTLKLGVDWLVSRGY